VDRGRLVGLGTRDAEAWPWRTTIHAKRRDDSARMPSKLAKGSLLWSSDCSISQPRWGHRDCRSSITGGPNLRWQVQLREPGPATDQRQSAARPGKRWWARGTLDFSAQPRRTKFRI